MPRRYSCSLVNHTTAYQVASQAKHMATLPQNLDSLRTASQAGFTSGFTLGRVHPSQVCCGDSSALLQGLPFLPTISF